MKVYLYPDKWDLCLKDPQGKFLFETDKDIEVGDLIKYHRRTYVVVSMNVTKEWCEVRPITINIDADENLYEDTVICPVCGYKHDYCDCTEDYDDDFQCQNCGATLQYSREVEVTYNTYVKEMPKVIKIEE